MKFQKINASKRHIKIGDVKTGGLFIYNDKVYMKLDTEDTFIDQNYCYNEDVECIALDLENAAFASFEEDMTCDLLNKEIVITYDSGDIKEWI